jgi:DNA repair protein SbcC/Rad50
MKKTSDLTQLLKTLNELYYVVEMEEEFPNYFYQGFLSGDNELYQKIISEVKIFHEDWIDTIESYFNSLDKITKNAKSGLRYEQEVVAIEKAKKINSDSVRHLAAHTHLIKEVRPDMVVPKKILTTQTEIEYAIYENRFIKTLIDRLFSFINNRYHVIKNNVESYQKKHFNLKSNFDIRESNIELSIDINIKEDLNDERINQENHQLLNRVSGLLKKVNGLRESAFMVELKKARPVIPPIMKTQILLKNVDYKNCYTLWLYLDKYSALDFDVEVKEQNLPFDKYYLKNVYQSALMAFTTVYGNQKELSDHYRYVDVNEYRKKSPKFIKKHLKDIINQPEPITMEDTSINQYYLEQNMKLFKDNIEKYQNETPNYEVALKKALRDTINITNSLYDSFFEFGDQDEDDEDRIFQRLVKEDLDSELLRAKDKARVARIIRETKEVDYNNAIRLEKKMMKEIDTIDKQILKKLRRRALDESKKIGIEQRIKLERENLSRNQGILQDYLSYISEQKQVLNDEAKAFTEKKKEDLRKIKEEEKILIDQEKKRVVKQYQMDLTKIKEKQRKEKLRIDTQIKEQRRIQREQTKQEKAKLLAQSKERIEKTKQKIEKDYQNKLL